MAHNLSTYKGRAAMFYVGEKPWHGLGTELDRPATAAEAISAAGLDWEVRPRRLVTEDGLSIPDKVANVRSDDGAYLGTVGTGYQAIQNAEAFSFFDCVVGQKLAIYHTAGALGAGERTWVLAKLPQDIIVAGKDKVEPYLLLSNSHNGTSSLRLHFTPVRVVCANTLAVASRGGRGEGVTIRHSGNVEAKVQEAQRILGIAHAHYSLFGELAEALVARKMNVREMRQYVELVVPSRDDEPSTRLTNIREAILDRIERGAGHRETWMRASAYAALNGVAEYADHFRTVRGGTDRERRSNRLESVWFGSGARLKEQATDILVKMVGLN